jgi:hypothetical protein
MTTENKQITDIDILRANINNETSRINWAELQRFFAGGWLIYVSSTTNLLDVAVAFSLDDKDQVSKWLNTGEVAKVSNEQAKQWHQENTTFWSTVVKPWVLIQPVTHSDMTSTQNNKIH